MTADSIRLIISNAISILSLALLCYSHLRQKKEIFLITSAIGYTLNVLVYVASGLWISVFSNLASITRNIYNAKAKKPKIWVNIIILLVASFICAGQIILDGGFTWYDILPLVSLIFYSIMIFVSKNSRGIMVANCIDACLWIAYDIENTMVVLVVIDLFNILIEATHKTLSILDKHFVFVNKRQLHN